jgi:hypothetical protein
VASELTMENDRLDCDQDQAKLEALAKRPLSTPHEPRYKLRGRGKSKEGAWVPRLSKDKKQNRAAL